MSARLRFVLALPALALAACATPHAPLGADKATTADKHEIKVTETAERLELVVNRDDLTLSYENQEKLRRFAREYVREGHGALVMSTPDGAQNADASRRAADVAQTEMAEVGVPFEAIARASYDAGGKSDAPIIISYLIYDAQAPQCEPLWSQDLAHNPDNLPWRSFGCSSQANLAAMVADAGDLLGPRDEDPRDAERRANVLSAYRKGKQTHADRSDDERVAVSKAVQ